MTHATTSGAASTPLQRLHATLTPDYNGKATVYWWLMVLLGGAAFAYSVWAAAALSPTVLTHTAIVAALAVTAGFFPVRFPGSTNSFAAGEIFIFLLLLMHGTTAAIIAVVLEAYIGARRVSNRWSSHLASPAIAALAMFLAGQVMSTLFLLMDANQMRAPGLLLLAAMTIALTHFSANTLFVSLVFSLKRGERFNLRQILSRSGSVGIAYGASALVAALLYLTVQYSGLNVLMGALPVILLMLVTMHYFLHHQYAAEAARKRLLAAEEREAEQAAKHKAALHDSEQRFQSAFTHASIGMALVTYDGRVLMANAALLALLGTPQATPLVTQSFSRFVVDEDLPTLGREYARIQTGEIDSFSLELRCRRQTGETIWVALHCGYFSSPDAENRSLIMQVQDISARRLAEARLQHVAFHDGLTGLPNRSHFHDLLTQALRAAKRDPRRHFGVMFLDFDRFKLVNDSMGHSAGDNLLIQVSRRIQDQVRPGDVVARLGGDEFAVLVQRVESPTCATGLAERLQQVFRQPLLIAGVSLTTSASIGITFSQQGYDKPEDLLRDADIAMYRAKAAGKACYSVFDTRLHTELASRVRLEADLRQALAQGAIDIAYQPLFNLTTGLLTGFEALARWNHPTLGDIEPAVFVPIAEESGLIVELTDLMLMGACQQVRQWQLRAACHSELKVQVNISGNDMAHTALAARVGRAWREAGLAPRLLTLELTENILMQRVDDAMATLEALRQSGVGLAIDDFGTGYSSLSYLSSLPIDSLKIDRSFVTGMRTGSKDAEIVRAIVSLGAALGKSVVAEGIETSSQFAQLRELGCEHGQGYHLSRPLTPTDVELLLDCISSEQPQGRGHFTSSGMMPLVRH